MFITKAAIMYSNGEVVEGHDYSRIDLTARKLGFFGDKIEGFITSSGEFVLPTEAAEIASQSGQVSNIAKLAPEHLWRQEMMVE